MSETICPICQGTNDASNTYCIHCGKILLPADSDMDRPSLRSELTSLRTQLDMTTAWLERLQEQIDRSESGDVPVEPSPPTESRRSAGSVRPGGPLPPTESRRGAGSVRPGGPLPPTESPRDAGSVRPGGPLPPTEQPRGAGSVRSDEPPRPVAPRRAAPAAAGVSGGDWATKWAASADDWLSGLSVDWEQTLGRNWLAIAGAIILMLGIGFFLKLSFDNNWINDTGRIVLGIVSGVALVGVGEFAQSRVPRWAQPVTASGISILYLSIYAAFALYHLIRPDAALFLLALVVALAGLLAIRYNSLVIGLLGIVGAFIAPVLLGPELPDIRLVLPYILVVDLGILWVSTQRNWRWFNLLGWAGSYGVLALGIQQAPDYDPILLQMGLTSMFLIFVGVTTLFHILWRHIPGQVDLALVAVNGTAFFGLTVGILGETHEAWLGLVALSLSLLYALITFVAMRREGAPRELAVVSLPMSIIFLTIAVPLQLTGVWITVAWAAQGAALMWTGFFLNRTSTRVLGLGVIALSLVRLVLYDTSINLDEFTLVLNERFPVFVAAIAAFYAAAYIYWRYRDRIEDWEKRAVQVLATIANVLTLAVLSLEAADYFYARAAEPFLYDRTVVNGVLLSLTLIWALYAAGLLAVGLTRRLELVRLGGLALLAVVVVKLLLVDTLQIEPDLRSFIAVLNPLFLTFVTVLAVLAATAYLYRRAQSHLSDREEHVFKSLLVAANVVALWAMSYEIITYFESRAALLSVDQINGVLLSLTLIWALYAAGLLAVGLTRRLELVRLGGLALLAVVVVKLLLVDTLQIEPDLRSFIAVLNPLFLTFVTVLAVLAATAYLYRRAQSHLSDREEHVFKSLLVAANVVALWAMSYEIITYFESRAALLSVNLREAMHLSLTVLWTVYAIAIIAVGIARQAGDIRRAGLVLLALPMVKLFVYDVFLLEQGYRVAAFITLGILLLGTGLAYQRYSQAVRGFLFGRQQ